MPTNANKGVRQPTASLLTRLALAASAVCLISVSVQADDKASPRIGHHSSQDPCDPLHQAALKKTDSFKTALDQNSAAPEIRVCVSRESLVFKALLGATGAILDVEGPRGNATLLSDPDSGGYALLLARSQLVDQNGFLKSARLSYLPDPENPSHRLEIDVDQNQISQNNLIGESFGASGSKVSPQDDWVLLPLPSPLPWQGASQGFKAKSFHLKPTNQSDILSKDDPALYGLGFATIRDSEESCLSRQGPLRPVSLSDASGVETNSPGLAVSASYDPQYSGSPVFDFDEDNAIQIRGIFAGPTNGSHQSGPLRPLTLISDRVFEAYKAALAISRQP
ncbi:MAG: hypothetical protein CL675_00870 [Bdellovibrionaceae bacterium]|nr:hypothetical protein [Pseudobdellovibrionaceae bacterium]